MVEIEKTLKKINTENKTMDLIGWGLKALGTKLPETTAASDIGDVYVSPSLKQQGVFKAYLPRHIYRPPFGYPRSDNVPLQRQLAKNPYIYSIKKSIKDEIACCEYDIKFREDSERKDDEKLEQVRKQIINHFRNPNKNKESWATLRRKFVEDVLEVDAGVLVKVFNRMGEYSQLFAYDGGAFLVNPDIHGYMGDRAEFIPPLNTSFQVGQSGPTPEQIQRYDMHYKEQAAYFQYGTATSASIPVPFGRREVVYLKMNPRSDEPYGQSPIALLADIILNLVYGANFSLDYYMNSNMPEGVLQILGAEEEDISKFRRRIEAVQTVQDETTGFARRVGYRVPITSFETKFTPFQLDPKTMQILEQQKWFYTLALACFGIPPNAVGLDQGQGLRTGDGDNQLKYYLRKSAKPIMSELKYKIDNEIIAEWGKDAYENLEYVWEQYDIDEENKKADLSQKYINMGVKTPKMIAEEEGIDFSEVEEYQKQKQEEAMQMQQPQDGEPMQDDESATQEVDTALEDARKRFAEIVGQKAKYIKREGSAGNYKYTYANNKKQDSSKKREEIVDAIGKDFDKMLDDIIARQESGEITEAQGDKEYKKLKEAYDQVLKEIKPSTEKKKTPDYRNWSRSELVEEASKKQKGDLSAYGDSELIEIIKTKSQEPESDLEEQLVNQIQAFSSKVEKALDTIQ